MKFSILVKTEEKFVTLIVEQVYLSDQIQQLKISGKDKSIIIQNDQPLFDKVKMKKVAPWKLIEGTVTNTEVFVETLRQVDMKVREMKKFN